MNVRIRPNIFGDRFPRPLVLELSKESSSMMCERGLEPVRSATTGKKSTMICLVVLDNL